jgi:triacylglycerol esterase/lipase EstA (alpha/beta hydrolase family)
MPTRRHPPLLIINGLGAPRLVAHGYGWRFRARGMHVWTVPQPPLLYQDIRASAQAVADRVREVLSRTGAARLNLVGMSLGGLIGLYYLKCRGGAAHVERFVSVGGPLNGVPMLDSLARFLPLELIASLPQARPGSELLRELQSAPPVEGVAMFSVGSSNDPLTPSGCWQTAGMRSVESAHGPYPVGHWMLFADPRNHSIVWDLLTVDSPQPAG